MDRTRLQLPLCATLALLLAPALRADPIPSFNNDVMAVLSKAGCNAGACHGNQNGKGGFKLSLRGQDPSLDYQSIVRDVEGRRLNWLSPEQSLLLLKPLAKVPHQGGRRIGMDSPELKILQDWIVQGA